jgi:hypothetical protein
MGPLPQYSACHILQHSRVRGRSSRISKEAAEFWLREKNGTVSPHKRICQKVSVSAYCSCVARRQLYRAVTLQEKPSVVAFYNNIFQMNYFPEESQ